MSELSYIVSAKAEWNEKYFEKYSKSQAGNWYFASNPAALDELLKVLNPKYIFFPHWSWVVPTAVINKYECICFHMTDLPYGRGGSPLQNLILQGYEKTMLTALRMNESIDTGPIYYKKPLSLHGSAHDIYKRAGRLCWDMIDDFIKENPIPVKQKGSAVNFKRRTPAQSEIPNGLLIKEIYDYIRMLDAPKYPKAFLETKGYRLEFENSTYKDGKLSAMVKFIEKKNNV